MKLDINQYLEEYTENAEIVSDQLGVDELWPFQNDLRQNRMPTVSWPCCFSDVVH